VTIERLTNAQNQPSERRVDKSLRPKQLTEYVGQSQIRKQLEIFIPAALSRQEALDHVLIAGPPGLGKCITANSYLLTASGWTEFSSVIPDTLAAENYVAARLPIYGLNGLEHTSHIYYSGIQATIRITTQLGFTLEGSHNHPVLVATPQGPRWQRLADVNKDDWLAIARGRAATPADSSSVLHEFTCLNGRCAAQKIVFSNLASKQLNRIQLLLTQWGIIGQQQPGTLVLDAHNSRLFQQYIGQLPPAPQPIALNAHYPEHIPYAHSLLKAAFEAQGSTHYPITDKPLSSSQVRTYLAALTPTPTSQILSALADPHIYWDSVAKRESAQAPVYDLCVPGSHSFIANGFYNHNTTLSHIIAHEMKAQLRQTSGPILERPGDLAALLTNLQPQDVLFIDEIHRLTPVVEEILYPAMEDFQLDIMIGEGPTARSVKIDLPPFTLVGATTRTGLLTSPLRDRFGMTYQLQFYTPEELVHIIQRSSAYLNSAIDADGAMELARRARGTPRIANRLLRRVRDYAQVEANGHISLSVAQHALALLEIDAAGLDSLDRKLLSTILEHFDGGPVGIDSLAAALGEDRYTLEEVLEPFLLQQGFLLRTRRGRQATPLAWQHLGLTPPTDFLS